MELCERNQAEQASCRTDIYRFPGALTTHSPCPSRCAGPPPTRQAEPRLVQVAHGDGRHFAHTGRHPRRRGGRRGFRA